MIIEHLTKIGVSTNIDGPCNVPVLALSKGTAKQLSSDELDP